MFENFIDCFLQMFCYVIGKVKLIEDNIKDILCEVCMVLFEVDVVLLVVKDFVNKVKECVVGIEVLKSLILGQVFVKIVCVEFEELMGVVNEDLVLSVVLLVVILMVGLQGVGKIIIVGKLVCFFKECKKKLVMVVFVDVY